MNYKNVNHGKSFHNIKIDLALKKLNGTRFLGEFTIKGEYIPVSVFFAENPDISQGHKNIFFLLVETARPMIGGMNLEEFEKYRYQNAIYCKKCDEVIYSKYRHHMHSCSCKSVSIDGGRDYMKVAQDEDSDFQFGEIDFLEGEFLLGGRVIK